VEAAVQAREDAAVHRDVGLLHQARCRTDAFAVRFTRREEKLIARAFGRRLRSDRVARQHKTCGTQNAEPEPNLERGTRNRSWSSSCAGRRGWRLEEELGHVEHEQ